MSIKLSENGNFEHKIEINDIAKIKFDIKTVFMKILCSLGLYSN